MTSKVSCDEGIVPNVKENIIGITSNDEYEKCSPICGLSSENKSNNNVSNTCQDNSSNEDDSTFPDDLSATSAGLKQPRPAKIFSCNRCSYETDRKNNLKRHVATMHDPVQNALDCCGSHFATKGDLRDHTRSAHGSGYTCWQCGHTFCRRALLHRHQSVHSGLKAFSCSKCGYQSSHKSNMQRHMQVHQQVKTAGINRTRDKLKPSFKCSAMSKLISQPLGSTQTLSSKDDKLLKPTYGEPNPSPFCSKYTFEPPSTIRNELENKLSTPSDEMTMETNSPLFNLDRNPFSRALTTLKTMHLSNLSEHNKPEMSAPINRINLSSASYMPKKYSNSEIKFSNRELWRLAFSNQYEPRFDSQTLDGRLSSIHNTQPEPDSTNDLISSSSSNTCTTNNKYSQNIKESPANITRPQPNFLPLYSSSMDHDLISSLTSPAAVNYCVNPEADNSSTSTTPSRGRCVLPRPIPRYRRLPTDFSVKTLLGSRSPPRPMTAGYTGAINTAGLTGCSAGTAHIQPSGMLHHHLSAPHTPPAEPLDLHLAEVHRGATSSSSPLIRRNEIPKHFANMAPLSDFKSSNLLPSNLESTNILISMPMHDSSSILGNNTLQSHQNHLTIVSSSSAYPQKFTQPIPDYNVLHRSPSDDDLVPLDCSVAKKHSNISPHQSELASSDDVEDRQLGSTSESVPATIKVRRWSELSPQGKEQPSPNYSPASAIDIDQHSDHYVPKKIRALGRTRVII